MASEPFGSGHVPPDISGSLKPLIATGAVMSGSAEPTLVTCGPVPGMVKLIVSVSALLLAAQIASRRLDWPSEPGNAAGVTAAQLASSSLSAVVVTVMLAA